MPEQYIDQEASDDNNIYSHLFYTIFFSFYRFEDKRGLWNIDPCLTVMVPSVLLRNCPWDCFFLLIPLPWLQRTLELAFACRVLSWAL